MVIIKYISFFLLLSTSYSEQLIKWNTEEIKRTVKPIVRKFIPSWENRVTESRLYHYKTHFGIIIKKDTTFTLKIHSYERTENVYFYCLTNAPREKFVMLNLAYETNSTRTVTTNFDCVPVTSVSYNIPVNVTITTKDWIILPVFNSREVTFLTSKKAESEFYNNLQIYGFVENYYTQMLLSIKDVTNIKSREYSLYLGLQNQADVIRYYNYLTGASRYTNENDILSYALVEKFRVFIRTEICETNCDYGAYFDVHWIACPHGVSDFLNPIRGSSWILLHEVAHYFDIVSPVLGFGKTVEVWTNIFSALYQHKYHVEQYWMKEEEADFHETVSKYQTGVPFREWGLKEQLHFFMSLFGYDGTAKSFREFNIRYYADQSAGKYSGNIIPTLLEVFLDLYDLNLLPFLRKVVNFRDYAIPLVNIDLELRLLSARAIMPAIDFNLNPADLQVKSKERDLRQFSPLMLLPKVKKMFVKVRFTIESPIDLFDRCLYLNNNCHTVLGYEMEFQILADVYSIYIAEKAGNKLYVSELQYYIIAKDMRINIEVKEIKENDTFLPLVYYTIDARCIGDALFLRTFINYKDMTIGIQQFTHEPHIYFENEIYYSIMLKRNGTFVFKYTFFGMQQGIQPLTNAVHRFQIDDEIHIYHREPNRMQIDLEGFSNESPNNIFIFKKSGLHNVYDRLHYRIISSDIKRIDKFEKDFHVGLSYNSLYQVYLDRYVSALHSDGLESLIPVEWMLFSD